MTDILFAFDNPTASGFDIPAEGVIECSLVNLEMRNGRTRTTRQFDVKLEAGAKTISLSPTGPGQAWRIAISWVSGVGVYHKRVPDSAVPLSFAALEDIDPDTLAVSVTGKAAWDATLAAVQAIAGSMVGELSVRLDSIDPGILVIGGGSDAPVAVAPAVTVQPKAVLVSTGGSATFTAAASGTPQPAVQWQVNGVNIVGATSTTLTVPGVAVGDTGKLYRAVFTNSAGTATTDAVALTVSSGTAPSIAAVTWSEYGEIEQYLTNHVNFAPPTGSPAPVITLEVLPPGASTGTWSTVAWSYPPTLITSGLLAGKYDAQFLNSSMFAEGTTRRCRLKATNASGTFYSPEVTLNVVDGR